MILTGDLIGMFGLSKTEVKKDTKEIDKHADLMVRLFPPLFSLSSLFLSTFFAQEQLANFSLYFVVVVV